MTARRPKGVTAVSGLAMLVAVFEICFAMFTIGSPGSPAALEWVRSNPGAATAHIVVTAFFGGIVVVAGYFIMRGRDWARWTYLVSSLLRCILAFGSLASAESAARSVQFSGAMIPGILLFLAACFAFFTQDARDFFYAGGRPWWQVQQEDDEASK